MEIAISVPNAPIALATWKAKYKNDNSKYVHQNNNLEARRRKKGRTPEGTGGRDAGGGDENVLVELGDHHSRPDLRLEDFS